MSSLQTWSFWAVLYVFMQRSALPTKEEVQPKIKKPYQFEQHSLLKESKLYWLKWCFGLCQGFHQTIYIFMHPWCFCSCITVSQCIDCTAQVKVSWKADIFSFSKCSCRADCKQNIPISWEECVCSPIDAPAQQTGNRKTCLCTFLQLVPSPRVVLIISHMISDILCQWMGNNNDL